MKDYQIDMLCSAVKRTAEVASMKDWRCRSKRARRMREIAHRWMLYGGCVYMSANELRQTYPDVVPAEWKDETPAYWCIAKDITTSRIDFIKLF